jgi:hypothetical protein
MNTETAREIFAAFHPDLQAAMRVAARVNFWDPATWVWETRLVDALIRSQHYAPEFIATLAGVYRSLCGADGPGAGKNRAVSDSRGRVGIGGHPSGGTPHAANLAAPAPGDAA